MKLRVVCSLFFASYVVCAWSEPQGVAAFCAYAHEHNLALPNRIDHLCAYRNYNNYGFTFEPTDPISKTFIHDVYMYAKNTRYTRVLDVGCGMGLLARAVLSLFDEYTNIAYVGLDLSQKNLAVATRYIAEHAKDAVSAWQPTVGTFPLVDYTDGVFTHIALFNVAHFWTPDLCVASLQKVEQLLAPGGVAYIYTTHPYSPAHAPCAQERYDEAQKQNVPFPGYVDDAPQYLYALECYKTRSQLQVDEASLRARYMPHFLYLTTEELCELIHTHTSLTVAYACTVDEAVTHKKYAAVIVRKND